jgi:hypothetical protein
VRRITKFAVAAVMLGGAAFVLVPRARAAAAGTAGPIAQRENARSVAGTVLGKNDVPLAGAVVYLKNTKTLGVKSYIADNSGQFRFASLSSNIDYELYAEFNGVRSNTKTISAFDSRTAVQVTLHIDVAK